MNFCQEPEAVLWVDSPEEANLSVFYVLFVFDPWKMSFVLLFAGVKSPFLEETGELAEALGVEKSGNGRN